MKPEDWELDKLDEDTKKLMRQVLWFAMQRADVKSPLPPPRRGTRCRIYPVPT